MARETDHLLKKKRNELKFELSNKSENAPHGDGT